MSLTERIQKDMVEAMKAKQELRLSVVRAIKTALLKYKADNMKDPDEAAEQAMLKTLAKQRMDSMEQFKNGNRPELAEKEAAELEIIEGYLPQKASAEDIAAAVEAAIAETGATGKAQMGLVMKAATAKLAGKNVDGKALSELVKSKLP
ncbi:MAG: GatB/YqeY domain-containing protein [Acidobacteria bacterium]|nr:GatB/YqeY domain-containing protein [Acidobacteriota bacterium]